MVAAEANPADPFAGGGGPTNDGAPSDVKLPGVHRDPAAVRVRLEATGTASYGFTEYGGS